MADLTWKDIVKLPAGDLATALIVGTTGAVIDAVYNPIGALTAYETGLASASAAVGAKKSNRGRLAKLSGKEGGEAEAEK